MKKLLYLVLSSFLISTGWFAHVYFGESKTISLVNIKPKEYPLAKYSIENLKKASIESGVVTIKDEIADAESYKSYLFEFKFKPDLENEKVTTGQINIPIFPEESSEQTTNSPIEGLKTETKGIILMLRGYVDQSIYQTGIGTRNAAAVFAENGYITIAPDFLGYAGSDSEAGNIFETRFQTYTTVLSLLKTLESLGGHPELISGSFQPLTTNFQPLFLWAHSNGGQIAFTVLTIVDKNYPTVLWAPVSKPFPYSVLYYTDESEDKGKFIRSELAKFEEDYDVNKYSFADYLENIKSPILLQQGTVDDAIPVDWSNSITSRLKNLDKDIDYRIYKGADHNLRGSWDEAVSDDLEFYKSQF